MTTSAIVFVVLAYHVTRRQFKLLTTAKIAVQRQGFNSISHI